MENNKQGVVLVGFGSGRGSDEGMAFPKYVGISPVNIVAINPNKAELEKIFPGRTYDSEPSYVIEEAGKAPQIRVDVYVKTVKDYCGVEIITPHTFFVTKETRFNANKDKMQVLNAYGESLWVTKEEFEKGALPEYKMRPNASPYALPYKPAMVGEEDLIDFIRVFLSIPNPTYFKKDTNEWFLKEGDELKGCMSSFSNEDIEAMFKGNFKSLVDTLMQQPNNKYKACFGVRTVEDDKGARKEYQTVCRVPIRYRVTDYTKFDARLSDLKANGAYANVEFGEYPYMFKEYTVKPTEVKQAPVAKTPW